MRKNEIKQNCQAENLIVRKKNKSNNQVSSFRQLPSRLPIPVPSRGPLQDWFHQTIAFCFLSYSNHSHPEWPLWEQRRGGRLGSAGVLHQRRPRRTRPSPHLLSARHAQTATGVTNSRPSLCRSWRRTTWWRRAPGSCWSSARVFHRGRSGLLLKSEVETNKNKNKRGLGWQPARWLQPLESCECCHISDFGFILMKFSFIYIFKEQKSGSVQINGDVEKEGRQTRHQLTY